MASKKFKDFVNKYISFNEDMYIVYFLNSPIYIIKYTGLVHQQSYSRKTFIAMKFEING